MYEVTQQEARKLPRLNEDDRHAEILQNMGSSRLRGAEWL